MNQNLQKHVPKYHEVTRISRVKTTEISRTRPKILDDECTILARHVVGQIPNTYVRAKYRDAHHVKGSSSLAPMGSFDSFLLRFARLHFVTARLVDTYTAIFLKESVFRRKAVLLLAILESCPPFYRTFDSPDAGHRLAVVLKLLLQGVIFVVFLVIAMVLLSPIRLLFTIADLLPQAESAA